MRKINPHSKSREDNEHFVDYLNVSDISREKFDKEIYARLYLGYSKNEHS